MHPDAESLNAFAEQALGERERGQIVAHLAECGRCREVVFLAQEAAAERMPELAAVGYGDRGAAVGRPWFRNWWLVWAPTAALGAVVGLAFHVHLRRAAVDAGDGESNAGGFCALVRPQNDAVTSRPTETPLATTAGRCCERAADGGKTGNEKANPAQVALVSHARARPCCRRPGSE